MPNYPGDLMVIGGRVDARREEDGETLIEVAYQGQNKLGPHVTGSAVLALAR